MTSKQRMVAALNREKTDRLPVTTHHVMPYFLDTYMGGITTKEFFDKTGLDPIHWDTSVKPDASKGEYNAPEAEHLDPFPIISETWRIKSEQVPDSRFETIRKTITTPKGNLTAVIQGNGYTDWVAECPLKEKKDIELFGEFQTMPICDVEEVNQQVEQIGQWGIVRGSIISNDIYGQPGCWQDFCCLRGTEKAIMDTFDDPEWVHEALSIIQARKLHYARSLRGATYDVVELGGGDASTTVINPDIFRRFVAPYDEPIIRAVQDGAGVPISYHTCGGMMPILEDIAGMGPVAMETFTPREMGADVDLAEAKRRIGDQVCMIGGFDQAHYFYGCTPEETRKKVRECFEAAGEDGGYILSPSDHFFDADPELVMAFADEARKCTY